MKTWQLRSAAVMIQAYGRLSVAYQRYGGWYDGKGREILIDNTQTADFSILTAWI